MSVLEKPRILGVKNVGRGEIGIEIICCASGIGSRLSYEALIRKDGKEHGSVFTLSPIEGGGGVFSFKPKSIEQEAVYKVKVKAVLDGRESKWSEEIEFVLSEFSFCIWSKCPDNIDVNRKYCVNEENPRIATKNWRRRLLRHHWKRTSSAQQSDLVERQDIRVKKQ